MSAKTNIWLATASALVLVSAPALAQTTTTDPNVTIVNPDGPAEQAGEAVDNAAGATVDATEDAAQAAGTAVENAAEATGEAAESAVETTTTTVETVPEGEMETDTEEVAEGTPVEGQIFEQSADTCGVSAHSSPPQSPSSPTWRAGARPSRTRARRGPRPRRGTPPPRLGRARSV